MTLPLSAAHAAPPTPVKRWVFGDDGLGLLRVAALAPDVATEPAPEGAHCDTFEPELGTDVG